MKNCTVRVWSVARRCVWAGVVGWGVGAARGDTVSLGGGHHLSRGSSAEDAPSVGSGADYVMVPVVWDNETGATVEVGIFDSSLNPEGGYYVAPGVWPLTWLYVEPGGWQPEVFSSAPDLTGYGDPGAVLNLDLSGQTVNYVTFVGEDTEGGAGATCPQGFTIVNLPYQRPGTTDNFEGFFVQGLCVGLVCGALWAVMRLVVQGVKVTSGKD